MVNKKAAIYIRTSSEHQAEKSSPDEQERDCRALAEQHDLQVVAVYRDTERYRVKTRLVDPSGTRVDRPGLTTMLNDAAEGHFNTIIAWKEDRLYRGLRAMLLVLDAIQDNELNVLLAKENFDPRMAPIKAWVAGMELEALKERMTMGVKARLRAGKANTGQDRYGYMRVGEDIEIVEEEAKWVRQIFEWYINRIPLLEIRRRLIEADAPQKGSSIPRKVQWAVSSIQGILKAAYEYAHGVKIQTRAGESFTIPVEPIINEETYQRFLVVREANKSYPARNLKRDYLIAGLMYCPCERKWGARTSSKKKKDAPRKNPLGVYFCSQRHPELRHTDCPKTIGSKKADDFVWDKIVEVLSTPEILINKARHYMAELQNRAQTAAAERERLQQRLDELVMERQWVITQARKGKITSEDMEFQLGALSMEEAYVKRELTNSNAIYDVASLEDWESTARAYLEDLWLGIVSLTIEPESDEEKQEQFQLKRKTVLGVVDRIEIGKDRNMKIVFKLDVLSLLGVGKNNTSDLQINEQLLHPNRSAGIYNHIQSCPLRHPPAACG
jgi:site-specific DNA recombinase